MTVNDLPLVNAVLNTSCTVLLLTGFYFIKRRRIAAHRAVMISAFAISILFLTSYLIYHSQVGTVHFTGAGLIRPVYFTILTSHTILAAALPFLVVITLSRALLRRFDRHKKLAHWTLPIWLYVSVTGVVIYLMLYRWYPAG